LEQAAACPRSVSPAVVVPFRDNDLHERERHLQEFTHWFSRPSLAHMKVYIIEQTQDGRKFNRGALLNVGARLALSNQHSSLVLHDVDLLPEDSILPYYDMLPLHPVHIGWAWTGKYNFANFMGGILSVSSADFVTANGFPNNFWGWGGEDDAFRNRIAREGIPVFRPSVRTGITELPHEHVGDNKEFINEAKRENVRMDTNLHGFSDVAFHTKGVARLGENIHKVTVQLF
jgi:hypothetical protein